MAANDLSIEIGDEIDLAWGMAFDHAKAGGSREDCPYDPVEQAVAWSEWMAGFDDGSR